MKCDCMVAMKPLFGDIQKLVLRPKKFVLLHNGLEPPSYNSEALTKPFMDEDSWNQTLLCSLADYV